MEELTDVYKLTRNFVLTFLKDEELVEALAKFYRQLYDALTKKGFSNEDAIKILTAQPLPTFKK